MATINKRTYQWVNAGFVLALVLLFCFVKFSVFEIHCVYKSQGELCPTCGTTRTLEDMLNFRLEGITANYIPFKVALFFVLQLLMRGMVLLALRFSKRILFVFWVDLSLSIMLIAWAFHELMW